MRGASPPLSHTCAVVVLYTRIVLEDGSCCYLSESSPSASAFKYMYVYRAGICSWYLKIVF